MKDSGKSEEIKIQGLYASISSICLASLLKTLSLKKKHTKLYHTTLKYIHELEELTLSKESLVKVIMIVFEQQLFPKPSTC